MNIENIPIPQIADKKIPEGAFEAELDRVSNFLIKSLKDKHTNVEDKLFTLPDDFELSNVFEFYRKEFNEKGFTLQDGNYKTPKEYKIEVWEKSGIFSSETVMIAIITVGETGSEKHFLNIIKAKK